MKAEDFIAKVFAFHGLDPQARVYGYGDKVSEHLTVGVDFLTTPDTNQLVFIPELIALYEKTREVYGLPIPVTSGFRTHAHELYLEKLGYKTAKFVSPHSLAVALDLDARPRAGKTEKQVNKDIREAVWKAAKALGLPRPRIGHRVYHERFNHIDLMFLLFKPFSDLEHPSTWEDVGFSAEMRFWMKHSWKPGVQW